MPGKRASGEVELEVGWGLWDSEYLGDFWTHISLSEPEGGLRDASVSFRGTEKATRVFLDYSHLCVR